MKKLAILAVLFAITACTGSRGFVGNQKTCENMNVFGISLNEIIAPCQK